MTIRSIIDRDIWINFLRLTWFYNFLFLSDMYPLFWVCTIFWRFVANLRSLFFNSLVSLLSFFCFYTIHHDCVPPELRSSNCRHPKLVNWVLIRDDLAEVHPKNFGNHIRSELRLSFSCSTNTLYNCKTPKHLQLHACKNLIDGCGVKLWEVIYFEHSFRSLCYQYQSCTGKKCSGQYDVQLLFSVQCTI